MNTSNNTWSSVMIDMACISYNKASMTAEQCFWFYAMINKNVPVNPVDLTPITNYTWSPLTDEGTMELRWEVDENGDPVQMQADGFGKMADKDPNQAEIAMLNGGDDAYLGDVIEALETKHKHLWVSNNGDGGDPKFFNDVPHQKYDITCGKCECGDVRRFTRQEWSEVSDAATE